MSSSLAERFPVLTQVAASERTLPVHDALIELLPSLQRGSTIACSGRAAVSLALALAAAPSREGAWVGIVGLPELGVRAAADMGLALERLVMVAGDGIQSTSTARTVRVQNGSTSVTDGPFAETKEQLGGFYLLDVKDTKAAEDWAAKIPGAQWGSVEVRPVIDYDG